MLENSSFPVGSPEAITWSTLKNYSGVYVLKMSGTSLKAALFSRELLYSIFSNKNLQHETEIIKDVFQRANRGVQAGLNRLAQLKIECSNDYSLVNELKDHIKYFKEFKKSTMAAATGTDLFIAAYKSQFDNHNCPQNQACKEDLSRILGDQELGLRGLLRQCDTEILSAEEFILSVERKIILEEQRIKFYRATSPTYVRLIYNNATQELIDAELLKSGTYSDLVARRDAIDEILHNNAMLHDRVELQLPDEQRRAYKALHLEIVQTIGRTEDSFNELTIRLPRDITEGERKDDRVVVPVVPAIDEDIALDVSDFLAVPNAPEAPSAPNVPVQPPVQPPVQVQAGSLLSQIRAGAALRPTPARAPAPVDGLAAAMGRLRGIVGHDLSEVDSGSDTD